MKHGPRIRHRAWWLALVAVVFAWPITGASYAKDNGPRPLTSGKGSDNGPVYSPNGESIAFFSFVDDLNIDLFVMDANGGHEKRLTANGLEKLGTPVWSPDGAKIAFTQLVPNDVSCCDYEIFAVNADGSGLMNVTNTPVRYDGQPSFDGQPTWSPDGTQIAFSSDRDQDFGLDIILMDADGSDQVNLTPSSNAHNLQPMWSGTKIAFTRALAAAPNPEDIYVMNSDGSDVVQLSNGSRDSAPVWSPNGLQIAFVSARNGISFHLFVMNGDGSGEIDVSQASANDPTWSPDSARLGYWSGEPGEVVVVDSDGSDPINVTGHPAFDAAPSWSPHGTSIAFVSNRLCMGGACPFHIWEVDAPN